MGMSRGRDLTEGNVFKLILEFSIPLLLGMLFQQFYSMVDTIIVGRYLGVKALAAVGSTGSINFMIIGFCMGVCNGFAIPIAQKFGAKKYKKLRKYVFNSAFLSAIFAIVMTVIVCVLCNNILLWMNTPSDIIKGAYEYIFVIFLGIPVIYLYNILSGIIRSLGDSKTPLYFLLISSGLNILLDLLFIIELHLGVAGAAWATVISQAIAGICCLIYMRKRYEVLKFEKDELKISGRCIKKLCYMGIPMGLQYSITAIGSVVLQTAVNGLGSVIVAAVAAAQKISGLLCCPFDALGSTMATYTGQNVGAKKLERISEGIKKSIIIGAVYSIIALMITVLFGSKITLLFVDRGEVDIISKATQYLITLVIFYIPLSLVYIVRFTIQGMGYSTLAILAGVCEMAARTLFGFVLVPVLGFSAACFASPIAWICADVFLIPAYKMVYKKLSIKLKLDKVEVVKKEGILKANTITNL